MAWTRRDLLALGLGATAGAGCLSAPTRSRGRPSGPAPFDAGTATSTVGFVGDVMLGRYVDEEWGPGDPAGVWGSTIDRLRALDGLVANLECCLSEGGERWPGKTYYFRADPTWAVPALAAADTSIAALANNHVLDFGTTGLRDTRSHLDAAGIAHAGAGPTLETALDPAVVDVGGLSVALVSLTDRYRPYAATEARPGTAYAPLDRADSGTRTLVRTALDRAGDHDPDLVVASLHWGPNWETAPAPEQVAFARWLIDRGVDVVHGHSAHVLQGVEVYRGRPIVYDAGDFVDDYVHKEGLHNKRSALFELVVTDGRLDALRVVPIEIRNRAATLAAGTVAAWVRETVRTRSEPFDTPIERSGNGLAVPLGDSGGPPRGSPVGQ